MKEYLKPTFEFVEMKPEEWLLGDSAGGGAQAKCKGNDDGAFIINNGCSKAG